MIVAPSNFRQRGFLLLADPGGREKRSGTVMYKSEPNSSHTTITGKVIIGKFGEKVQRTGETQNELS